MVLAAKPDVLQLEPFTSDGTVGAFAQVKEDDSSRLISVTDDIHLQSPE